MGGSRGYTWGMFDIDLMPIATRRRRTDPYSITLPVPAEELRTLRSTYREARGFMAEPSAARAYSLAWVLAEVRHG